MSEPRKWFQVAPGEWEYRPYGSVVGMIKRTNQGYKWALASQSGIECHYADAQQKIRNVMNGAL